MRNGPERNGPRGRGGRGQKRGCRFLWLLAAVALSAGPAPWAASQCAAAEGERDLPRVGALACPDVLLEGLQSACLVSLRAAPGADTVVPLAVSDASFLGAPASATVPAQRLSATFPITARLPGVVTLTAGPLNGSSQRVSIRVLARRPSLARLGPGGEATEGPPRCGWNRLTALGTHVIEKPPSQDEAGSLFWWGRGPRPRE